MSEVGARIRELRLAQKKSQRDLAAEVGVGFPHISKVENGQERPSSDFLRRVAAALGADLNELFTMADRLPEDLARFAAEEKTDLASMLLRKWKSGEITDDQVRRLIDSGEAKP